MKETLDILVLVRAIADAIDKAKSDGKLDWFDLPKIADLREAANQALRDSQNIPAELLDLDGDEVKILLDGMIAAIQKLYYAIRQ
jgi:hypothetical protein